MLSVLYCSWWEEQKVSEWAVVVVLGLGVEQVRSGAGYVALCWGSEDVVRKGIHRCRGVCSMCKAYRQSAGNETKTRNG